MRAAALRSASRRVAALRVVLLLVFFALAGRAAQLAVGSRAHEHGIAQVHTRLRLPPERGLLVDRRGAALAVSVRSPSVYALPAEIEDPESSASALARQLGLDAKALAARLREGERFLYVKRWVSAERAAAILALGLPGVGIVHEPRRAYPSEGLAPHLVGFANIDGKGVRGAEELEDEWLRGHPLVVPVQRDARGRLFSREVRTARDSAGGDVALTLDAGLQAAAELALEHAVRDAGAKGGIALSLDPRTGDILALAEWPRFDPNRFRELSFPSTRARAFVDAFEPGSTLKVFLAAAALESAAIAPGDLFDCRGALLRVPGKTIRDRRDFGVLDVADMLRVSSNVGAVQIAQRLGPRAHYEALRRFGFGEATGSRFPFESSGVLRSFRDWQPVDHATVAFGQGLAVTPIQLAAATAAIVDGGTWRQPRLVAARRGPEGPWRLADPAEERQVLRPEVASQVLGMMEGVVGPDGTGRRAAIPGLRVAGKTGTAQKLRADGRGYSNDDYLAWFIGAAPADDPALVVVVVLDEPRGRAHTGGAVAAPLFATIASAQLGQLGIVGDTRLAEQQTEPRAEDTPGTRSPSDSPDTEILPRVAAGPSPIVVPSEALKSTEPPSPPEAEAPAGDVALVDVEVASPAAVSMKPAPTAGNPESSGKVRSVEVVSSGNHILVPDFRGLSLAEVRRITTAHTVELESRGEGRAVEQHPAPGTILARPDWRVQIRFAPEEERFGAAFRARGEG